MGGGGILKEGRWSRWRRGGWETTKENQLRGVKAGKGVKGEEK